MEKKQSSIISAAVKQLDIPGELRIDNNWYSFEDTIKENILDNENFSIISIDSNDTAKEISPDGEDIIFNMKVNDNMMDIDFDIEWVYNTLGDYVPGYFEIIGTMEPDPDWLEDNNHLTQDEIDNHHRWEGTTARMHEVDPIEHIDQMISKINLAFHD